MLADFFSILLPRVILDLNRPIQAYMRGSAPARFSYGSLRDESWSVLTSVEMTVVMMHKTASVTWEKWR